MVPSGQSKEHLDTLDLGVRDGLLESQLAGYEKIMELCKEHDISLTFIETPKYEKLLNDTREGCYSQLLQEMVSWAENQGANYLLAEEVSFDHGDGGNFQDLIHLSGQGRKTYCAQMCEVLK